MRGKRRLSEWAPLTGWGHPTSSKLGISGKTQAHLCLGDPIWGGCGKWAGSFFNHMHFYGFVFLVKFPAAAGLIKTE